MTQPSKLDNLLPRDKEFMRQTATSGPLTSSRAVRHLHGSMEQRR